MVVRIPIPIDVQPTFTPTTDNTALAAGGYTSMDKIQFVDGAPETIAGWASIIFSNSVTISGKCRTIYSQYVAGDPYLLLGTHTYLYSNIGSTLTNITPLVTTTTNLAANPITTYNDALGANPLTTINGSKTVTVAHASHRYIAGDIVTMSGATTTNGIPNTDLNVLLIVRSVVAGVSYTISVNTAATSGGTGGGAGVIIASGLITVADTTHGFNNGDRILLAASAATRGITAVQINKEHIIRNKAASTYDIMTSGTSTSAGTGGGAAPITRRGQIAAGEADASSGIGYSAGLYSDGIYSAAAISASTNILPRIYSMSPYGSDVILTPGSQTGVYRWAGDTATAPVAVTNAPTAVNYVFVDREIVVTLGQGGVGNRIKTSDRGQSTTWTGTSQNEVYEDDVEGAGTFVSHANIGGVNLLFTNNEMYTMSYLGKPAIWQVQRRYPIGIIAQNARVVVEDVCYFMSSENLYSYDGSILRPLMTKKFLKYIYNNINRTQQSKCFLSYREKNNQLIIRWPSANSNEPNYYITYNIREGNAASGTMDRTAEEYPFALTSNPRAVSSSSTLYQHEFGVNADGAAMSWHLETGYLDSGKNVIAVHGVIPDSVQTGNITYTCTVKDYPQSSEERVAAALTVTPITDIVNLDETIVRGKIRKHRLEGNALNGSWRAGGWQELVSVSTPRV